MPGKLFISSNLYLLRIEVGNLPTADGAEATCAKRTQAKVSSPKLYPIPVCQTHLEKLNLVSS